MEIYSSFRSDRRQKLFEDIRYHLGKLVHITAAGGNSWKIVLFLLNAVKSCDSYLLRNLYPSLAEHFADSYCHRIVYADYCFGKTVGVIKKALHYLLGGIGIEAAVAETLFLKRNAMLSQHLLVYCLTPFGNAVALYARNTVYLSKMVLFRQMIYQLIKSVGLIKSTFVQPSCSLLSSTTITGHDLLAAHFMISSM